jgi:hypothetical protein
MTRVEALDVAVFPGAAALDIGGVGVDSPPFPHGLGHVAHRSRRAPSIKPSGSLVRVLIAPPITHRTAEISGERRQIPCIGAFRRVDLVSGFFALCLHGRYGPYVSAPQNHFSWGTESDLTRDWFEMDTIRFQSAA